jgi:hypothetical protein
VITLRRLVWLYLVLLIFEGSLRKWIIPSLDAPLLIVRDPVVLLIYFFAYQHRLSFSNGFFTPNLGLAILAALTALLFGSGNLVITLFGLRADFLQIPLIFLIPQIINREDVIVMGRFLLLLSLPLAALVVLQFRSSPDSWLNRGALESQYGTVRPSSVFSFTTSVGSYFSIVAAFLLYGAIQRHVYKIWLLLPSAFATLLAAACSGSRNCLVSIGLVAAVAILCVIIRGQGRGRIIVVGVLIFAVFELLSSMTIFQEGSGQMVRRFNDAGATEGNTEGFINRFVGTLTGPLEGMGDTPLFGAGLGMGTNAAAGLLYGKREFLGAEVEWGRLIFECGPILGVLLCVFRTLLTFAVARRALEAFYRGNILPPLIFSAVGLLILNGQWGVPNTLGFAIFGAGLTLAACEDPPESEDEFDGEDEFIEEEVADRIVSYDDPPTR